MAIRGTALGSANVWSYPSTEELVNARREGEEPLVAERIALLRTKLAGIPESPGVYLHRDAQGKVIYVGKARNLWSRLHSYFYGLDRQTPKTQALVARIVDFEIIVTANEHESLVLENNLIKFHKPQYNILLRDDKTFPFLRLDPSEAWPRVTRTRRRKNDGAHYFGPYTSGSDLAHLTRVIDRFFMLVKCPPSVFRAAKRPCNYYHIKQCLGPCALEVDKQVYAANVKTVVGVLNGKTHDLVVDLEKRMMDAAETMRFELAAQLRDQIRALGNLGAQKQSVHLDSDINADFIGVHWQKSAACFYVSKMREGKLLSGDNFVVERMADIPVEAHDSEQLSQEIDWQAQVFESFLCQYYMRNERPDHVVSLGAHDIVTDEKWDLLEMFLDLHTDSCGTIRKFYLVKNITAKSGESPLLGRKGVAKKFRTLCESANETAKERFKDWMRTSESARDGVEKLAQFLNMESLPVWIECFDISTFQGTETVASQVVFRDGKPARGEYRRYVIREVQGQDDFGSLREVMRRRFKEERRHDIPDLAIVDGGEPQVREVSFMLRAMGLGKVGVVGIAKARTERSFSDARVNATEERIVIPARVNGELAPEYPPLTKVLRVGSPEFRLVTRMRDEAHRFAITLHRNRRDKLSRMSQLHRIEGLGPKRRKALLMAFSGIDEIRSVSVEEIAQKSGLTLAVAQKVKEALQSGESNCEAKTEDKR